MMYTTKIQAEEYIALWETTFSNKLPQKTISMLHGGIDRKKINTLKYIIVDRIAWSAIIICYNYTFMMKYFNI